MCAFLLDVRSVRSYCLDMDNANTITTESGTYVSVARFDLPEGMAVTVFESRERGTFHVGLLDVDSGNYVDGSVRIYPVRETAMAYAEFLINKAGGSTGMSASVEL